MTTTHLNTRSDAGRQVGVQSSNATNGGLYLCVESAAGHIARADAIKLAKSLAAEYLGYTAEPTAPKTPEYAPGTPLVVTKDTLRHRSGEAVVVCDLPDEDREYLVESASGVHGYVHESALAPFIELDAPNER